MIAYIGAFLWGGVILLSLIGWGGALRWAFFRHEQLDWGLKAAWGMAFSVCLGGVLNLVGAISRGLVLCFLGLGLASFVADCLRRRKQRLPSASRSPWTTAVLAAALLLAVFRYAAAVSNPQQERRVSPAVFNIHDDFQGYFVFPVKMLETGSMGADPFNERRLTASLGGQSFLHALVLSVLSPQNLHLLDPGVALLVAVGLLLGLFRQFGTPPIAAALILFCAVLLPAPTGNISALLTGLTLFLGLARTLCWEGFAGSRLWKRAMLLAFLAAGTCALKSNLIPAVGLFFAFSYGFRWAGDGWRRETLKECLLAAWLTVLFLLPWMVSMYQSGGTLLFPLLGRGYHATSYPGFFLPGPAWTIADWVRVYARNLAAAPIAAVLVLALATIAQRHDPESRPQYTVLALLLAALAGTAALVGALEGIDIYRYSFAFVVPAVLLGATLLLSEPKASIENRRRPGTMLAALLSLGLLLFSARAEAKTMFRDYAAGVRFGQRGKPMLPEGTDEEYKRLQLGVPAGETILARLAYPFLLDFRRNRVLVPDWPGGASPPPGMPLSQGSEALADYLLGHSIRYVAYSYASEANYPKTLAVRLGPESHPLTRATTARTFTFQNYVSELGATRRRLYDDGTDFVLDLGDRAK